MPASLDECEPRLPCLLHMHKRRLPEVTMQKWERSASQKHCPSHCLAVLPSHTAQLIVLTTHLKCLSRHSPHQLIRLLEALC